MTEPIIEANWRRLYYDTLGSLAVVEKQLSERDTILREIRNMLTSLKDKPGLPMETRINIELIMRDLTEAGYNDDDP